jgi:hypothetical protein
MANTSNRSMMNTVRSGLGQLTGNRSRGSRGRNSRERGGLASQATGFISGFLSGGGRKNTRSRKDTRSRSRSSGRRRR